MPVDHDAGHRGEGVARDDGGLDGELLDVRLVLLQAAAAGAGGSQRNRGGSLTALLCSAPVFSFPGKSPPMHDSARTPPDAAAAAALGRSCYASHPRSAHQPDDRIEGSPGNPGQQPKPQ